MNRNTNNNWQKNSLGGKVKFNVEMKKCTRSFKN